MERFTGFIDHFLYKNDSNGYGVIELDTEDEDFICVGYFTGITQGDTIEVEGDFTEHPVYGMQLKVTSFKRVEPTGLMDMERYLASGAVKGVGPTLAKRIIKKFGKDTFRIIEEEPERLSEIKGISERIAREIASQMVERRELRDTLMFLQKYGISNNMAIKLYNAYGSAITNIIMENPYRLVDDVDGIGFKKADELASKIGIAVDSQWRIQSGIKYVLNEASFEGHSYLPIQVLADRTYVLLGVAQSLIETEIQNLIVDRKIVMRKEDEETCVYSTRMYYDEVVCARLLHELNLKSEETDRTHIMRRLDDVEKELDISLDELQREAVCLAIENNVMILTGGPGTGKTTTINTLIRYFDDEGLDFMLAAPTGRAAKRMTETTGYEARTIHRLLELSGNPELGGVRFERNEDNPLETDLVIIDEMSMVDIDMFAALLKAVPIGARLILVGDIDQLPSVGPGRVLQDLIASERLATCQLERIFRQESRSDIVLNAHKIKAGERILLDNKSKDFFFLERSDTNVIYKHMVTLIKDKLPGYVDATPMQIQVLTPTRIGNLGTVALNKVLQMHLNPPSPDKKEVTYGDTVFREGDKVMQTRNNYTLEWKVLSTYGISADNGTGVFNGDIGVIKDVRTPLSQMVIEFDDGRRVEYPFASLDELELAYAVTIHKSQGSEYPAVVMPLLGGPRMLLNRNLLYTGITRARKCVTILGSRETVDIMIDNKDENMRYSGLASMIRQVEE